MTLEKAIRLYQRGVITDFELGSEAIETIAIADTSQEVKDIIDLLPANVYEFLEEREQKLPKNDDLQGWEGMLSFSVVASSQECSEEEQEEQERQRVEQNERSRVGWFMFRRYLEAKK